MRRNKLKVGFWVLFFTIAALQTQSQNRIDSPYSRFGVGILHGKNVNTVQQAMGGISLGLQSNNFINPENPASYTGFDSLSFLFEAGIAGQYVTLKTTEESEIASNATLSYIMIGMPINRWWRSSLGLLPYSQIGYNVNIELDQADVGLVVRNFFGDGGLNQIYWGNAFRVNSRLSLGINSIFIFGKGENSQLIYFPDSIYRINTKSVNTLRGNDFIFEYGLQYDFLLKNDLILRAGLIYGNRIKLRSDRESVSYTVIGGTPNNIETVKDTVSYNPSEKGDIIIPDKAGLGLVLEKKDRFMVGLDFKWQNWAKFEAFGEKDPNLTDSWELAVGGELKPSNRSIDNYFSRINYRLGGRIEQTYINVLGQQVNELGISFGFGLPLKRNLSTIDLSVEFGRRGTTQNNLIQENFINFTLGVAIYERWFVQRKYY